MDIGHIADDLLTQMYHNSKKAGATPSGATADGQAAATTAAGRRRRGRRDGDESAAGVALGPGSPGPEFDLSWGRS